MAFLERLARRLIDLRSAGRGGVGRRGERAAERFLVRLGYRVVQRNWTCDGGEFDLIAWDGPTLVFVEVKATGGDEPPEDRVTATKRKRLRWAARVYLARYRGDPPPARFDVIAVVFVEGERRPTIRHYVHAFEG